MIKKKRSINDFATLPLKHIKLKGQIPVWNKLNMYPLKSMELHRFKAIWYLALY